MSFPARRVSFLVGFLSLSSETLWVRTYGFANESTPKALSIVLCVYLLGIALGAWHGGKLCQAGADLKAAAARAILLGSACLVATPLLVMALPRSNPLLLALMLLPALFYSICFPICHHLGTRLGTGTAGRSLAGVYASNILGSVTGPLVTNFLILQWATTQTAFTLIGIAGLLVAMGLWGAAGMLWLQRGPVAAALGLAVLALGVEAMVPIGLVTRLSADTRDPIRRVVETRQGIVVSYVDDKLGDAIFGGNVYDGRTNVDPRVNSNQINRILVLAALNPRPKRVLVIGLSIGSWQYLIGGFPGVEKMDVIEINPGYIDLIKDYGPQERAIRDPRVNLIIGDGRKFLRQNPDVRYDLVVMNTTWHWRAYVSLLLSQEFLTLVKGHMTPAAVLAFNTTGSPDSMKTAATVFPHAYLYGSFVVAGGFDWRQRMSRPQAIDDLMAIAPEGRPLFAPEDRPLVAHFLDRKHTRDLASVVAAAGRPVEVITDRNLITEYRYGRR